MFAVSAPHSLPLEGKGQDTDGGSRRGLRQRSSWRCYMLLLWEKQTNKHLPTPCKGHHRKMENWISIIDYGICFLAHKHYWMSIYFRAWKHISKGDTENKPYFFIFTKSLFHVNTFGFLCNSLLGVNVKVLTASWIISWKQTPVKKK